MRILVSNDDGIAAAGIRALAEAMATLGDVWVVAPQHQRSASSHAISLHHTIKIQQVDIGIAGVQAAFAVDGTPVDCVKWAIVEFGKKAPFDLMVAGINAGKNLATDVLYSGTVAAAGEAGLHGVRSIAFSLAGPPYPFSEAAEVALAICRAAVHIPLPPDTFLSVNFPPAQIKSAPWRITRLGVRRFHDRFELLEREGDLCHVRYQGDELTAAEAEDADIRALARGEVSITPLCYHFTHDEMVERLRTDQGLRGLSQLSRDG
ncbi:5'-nucleotidase SurE [Alicyclobacillus cellulosilyticus]|uniref:5'-nucleotidase SurE n=1 Tax=Alicyclobacillus cellulosilyticus TaxID=1003997 RepID=A0A917KDT0_9BACL|nr:5'/3'-nucleotidase SurE [Alicyclobacillus cellulosilyticus]GGJ07297.1 5'-nucleotidase SurE [Alicyclobacillus cellulosilyticus]